MLDPFSLSLLFFGCIASVSLIVCGKHPRQFQRLYQAPSVRERMLSRSLKSRSRSRRSQRSKKSEQKTEHKTDGGKSQRSQHSRHSRNSGNSKRSNWANKSKRLIEKRAINQRISTMSTEPPRRRTKNSTSSSNKLNKTQPSGRSTREMKTGRRLFDRSENKLPHWDQVIRNNSMRNRSNSTKNDRQEKSNNRTQQQKVSAAQ